MAIGSQLLTVLKQFTSGAITIGIVVLIIAFFGGVVWWFVYKRKTYNIPVEIKIPRSDGRMIDSEWAKGRFQIKGGESVFILKRKGMKKVAMPPPDISLLQGKSKTLTLIQKGLEEYHPVVPYSWQQVYNDNHLTNILDLKTKDYKVGAWGNYYERSRKSRFSFDNFMQKYGAIMMVGVVVVIMFTATAILWSQLNGVADALAQVAVKMK